MAILNPVITRGGQPLLTRRGLPRMRPLPDARNGEDLGAVVDVVFDQFGNAFVTLNLPVAVPGLILVFRGEVGGTPTDVTWPVPNPQVGQTTLGPAATVMGALFDEEPSYATCIVEDGKVGSPGPFTATEIVVPINTPAHLTSVSVVGSGVIGGTLTYAYTWTGYPAPSVVSVLWRKEGVDVSGDASWIADGTNGEFVTVTLTISNGVGDPDTMESPPISLTAQEPLTLLLLGDPEDFTALTLNFEE